MIGSLTTDNLTTRQLDNQNMNFTKNIGRLLTAILIVASFVVSPEASAQTPTNDTIYAPDIIYSPIPKVYEIAGIKVTGVPDVEDYVIIGYSGLSVG